MSNENLKRTHAKLDRSEIAYRAYDLWCAAGRPAGRDLEFWIQAEAELLAAAGQSRPEHREQGKRG